MFKHQPTHPNAFGNPANLGNLGNPASYYANGFKQSEGRYIDRKKECRKRQRRFRITQRHVNPPTNLSERLANNRNMKMGTANGAARITSTMAQPTGRKEGVWLCYEEDGETVWRIITYKKGGSRAKPDEYPLGTCDVCGEGRRSTGGDTCPKCGAMLDAPSK